MNEGVGGNARIEEVRVHCGCKSESGNENTLVNIHRKLGPSYLKTKSTEE